MHLLSAILESVFKIRREEQKTVLLMFLYTMCAVAAPSVVGRTVSNTLFLKRLDKAHLPYTYIAVAIVTAVLLTLLARFGGRFRRDRTMKATCGVLALAVLGLRWMLEVAPNSLVLLGTIYLVVEVMADLLLINFWTMANDIFTTRAAKRVFGFIAGGGSLSFVLIAALVSLSVKSIGVPNLMFLMAGLLLVCMIPIGILGKMYAGQFEEGNRKGSASRSGSTARSIRQEFARVGKSKLLASIAGIIALTTVVTACIDYQWKVNAQAAFTADENALAAYFSTFFLVAGMIQIVFQFLITGRLLERLGVFFGLCLLPAAILVSCLGYILGSSSRFLFWTATGAKGSDMIFRFTIHNTSLQILYLPVSSELRAKAKLIIDGLVKPFAGAMTGLMILGITFRFQGQPLSYIAILMIGAWIALVPLALRHYKLALADSIRRKRIDFSRRELVLDEATNKALVAALEGDSERNAANALEMVKSYAGKNWDPQACKLLRSRNAGLRIQALEHLGREGNIEVSREVQSCFRDKDPEVRAAAINAYCAIGGETIVGDINPLLADPNPRIKSAVIAGMILYGGLDGMLAAAGELKTMLSSPD